MYLRIAGKIIRIVILTGAIILVLVPFYFWVRASIPHEAAIDAGGSSGGISPVVGTPHYMELILTTFLYSIPTALIAAFIHTILAFGLAYGMARGQFPLKEELRLICFLALFVPATLIISPLYGINSSIGIQGHFAATFFAMWSLPWLTTLLFYYLIRLPERIELYAAADGMTPKQIFTDLILPYSYKGLIAISLLSFLINYHSLFAAAASLPEGSFSATPTPSFSYLPVMISIFRQPADIVAPSAKLLAALIFQIPSFIVLPFLLIYGIPMLRTILTGRFGMRMKRGVL